MPRVEVPLEGILLEKLSAELAHADPAAMAEFRRAYDELRRRGIFPHMVAQVKGLSIKIWADEHPPPHFHVDYQGQSASFSILTCERLRGVSGLERYEKPSAAGGKLTSGSWSKGGIRRGLVTARLAQLTTPICRRRQGHHPWNTQSRTCGDCNSGHRDSRVDAPPEGRLREACRSLFPHIHNRASANCGSAEAAANPLPGRCHRDLFTPGQVVPKPSRADIAALYS